MHCTKSAQIWSFFGPYFPLFGLNMGKQGPEKSPYLDTFYAVNESKQGLGEVWHNGEFHIVIFECLCLQIY